MSSKRTFNGSSLAAVFNRECKAAGRWSARRGDDACNKRAEANQTWFLLLITVDYLSKHTGYVISLLCKITFAILLIASFVLSNAFYVNRRDININGDLNKNFSDATYKPINDDTYLNINEEKKAPDRFINLNLDHSTESSKIKVDLNEKSSNIGVVDKGTLTAPKVLPKKELETLEYSKNYAPRINNTAKGESLKHNAKTDSENSVNKREKSTETNVAPTNKGNVTRTSDYNDAGNRSGDEKRASYQSEKFEPMAYAPSVSTTNISKTGKEISDHVEHIAIPVNRKHELNATSGYKVHEGLQKKGQSNKTDSFSSLLAMNTQLRQEKRLKGEKSSSDNERATSKAPDKSKTLLEISTQKPLSSNEHYRHDKYFRIHANENNNQEVSTTTNQMIPEFLTTLLTARSHVAFTDFDLSSTELPKIPDTKTRVPELSEVFERKSLSEKPNVTVIRIDPEDLTFEINATHIEIDTNDRTSNNENDHDNTKNYVLESPNNANKEISNVTNNYEHVFSRFEINTGKKEITANTYLQTYGSEQWNIDNESHGNSRAQDMNSEIPQKNFTSKNDTHYQNLLGIELEQTNSVVIDDSLKTNISKKSSVYTNKIQNTTIDYYDDHRNNSFKTNYNRSINKGIDIVTGDILHLSRDGQRILKPQNIISSTIESFEIPMSNQGHSLNQNDGLDENGEINLRNREHDLNDELTSETQILPTVYTIEHSPPRHPQDGVISIKHENKTIRYSAKKEYHTTDKGLAKSNFDVPKISSSKNIVNIENKTKVPNFYPVSPSYKRFKKLEVSSPKPFRRDPNDNTWRNQSISSLGIVYKAKANASKPLTVVLKDKTEAESGTVNVRENRTELELRQRLEKLSELRKSKKKLVRPTTESLRGQKSRETDKVADDITTTPIFTTTATTATGSSYATTTTPITTLITTAGPLDPEYTDRAVFTATPRPFKIAAQKVPQRVVLLMKKANDDNVMYYDTVESLAHNDDGELIPWTVWDTEKTSLHDERPPPGPRPVLVQPPAQYYLPPQQTQKHHDPFEERLYTAVNFATADSLRKRSKNSIERWPLVDPRDGARLAATPRAAAAAVSVIRRGDDYGEVSYIIDHDVTPMDGHRTRPNRSHPARRVDANAIHRLRAVRNEEDYDYHDRLQLTDLEKFSFTYNSDRFTGDVPILFDTSVVRVDAAPPRQRFAEEEEFASSATTESSVDGGTDGPAATSTSRPATARDQDVSPLRSYEVNPFGTFFLGQDDE